MSIDPWGRLWPPELGDPLAMEPGGRSGAATLATGPTDKLCLLLPAPDAATPLGGALLATEPGGKL